MQQRHSLTRQIAYSLLNSVSDFLNHGVEDAYISRICALEFGKRVADLQHKEHELRRRTCVIRLVAPSVSYQKASALFVSGFPVNRGQGDLNFKVWRLRTQMAPVNLRSHALTNVQGR